MKQLTKKLFIILMAAVMIFTFSCVQPDNPQNPTQDNSQQPNTKPGNDDNSGQQGDNGNNGGQQGNDGGNTQQGSSGNNGGQQGGTTTPEQTFKGNTVNLIYAYDLESIDDNDADMFTHVCIAFLQHDADSTTLKYDHESDLSGLKESIKNFKAAHPKVKVLISYGGGDTGSDNASAVLNSSKYDELVNKIGNFVKTSGVDGIDFDWEYFEHYDTYNPIYPKFVADVKKIAGSDKLYTMAVQTGDDFYGDSGIQGMLKTLDFVNVMTYDFDYDSRAKKQIGYNGNFQSTKNTINAYINIVGADRTVAGLPFYGIGYEIEGSTITVKRGTSTKGKGTEDGFYKIYKYTDGKCLTNAKYVTGDNQEGAVAYYIGTRPSNPRKPAEGSYPFIYFYDDPVTIDIKVKWALETKGCIGAMAWVYEDDTEDGILRHAMTTAVKKYTKYEKEDTNGGEVQTKKVLKLTKVNNKTDRFQFKISGFDVTASQEIKIIIKAPEGTEKPLLRTYDGSSDGKFTTTTTSIETGDWAGWSTVTASASKDSAGIMVTLNGTFFSGVETSAYIAQITINGTEIDLKAVESDIDTELTDAPAK